MPKFGHPPSLFTSRGRRSQSRPPSVFTCGVIRSLTRHHVCLHHFSVTSQMWAEPVSSDPLYLRLLSFNHFLSFTLVPHILAIFSLPFILRFSYHFPLVTLLYFCTFLCCFPFLHLFSFLFVFLLLCNPQLFHPI